MVRDQSCTNNDIETILQEKGLLSPSTQVALDVNKKEETIKNSETPFVNEEKLQNKKRMVSDKEKSSSLHEGSRVLHSKADLRFAVDITSQPMVKVVDSSIDLTSSPKEFDSMRPYDEKLHLNYLFSFDTISASNHCCLRMMKAAKKCLLQCGYNVAGCFISMKNKGCLETKGENSVNLGCYRHLERESNWITSTVPGEMIFQ